MHFILIPGFGSNKQVLQTNKQKQTDLNLFWEKQKAHIHLELLPFFQTLEKDLRSFYMLDKQLCHSTAPSLALRTTWEGSILEGLQRCLSSEKRLLSNHEDRCSHPNTSIRSQMSPHTRMTLPPALGVAAQVGHWGMWASSSAKKMWVSGSGRDCLEGTGEERQRTLVFSSGLSVHARLTCIYTHRHTQQINK